MRYLNVPLEVSSTDVISHGYKLSAKSHKKINLKNKNFKKLSELLTGDPIAGKEVGSLAYVKKSEYCFLRTKAIQSTLYSLDLDTNGTFEYIKPKDFKENVGKNKQRCIYEYDLLFVTGGNVGEVALAQTDFENTIYSSHMLKLPVAQQKLYLFSFLKHSFCKEQANFSPEGAIKGLDTFDVSYLLNIKIPFPNHNEKEVIRYIEELTRAAINKEVEIKRKHNLIHEKISSELVANQKPDQFKYEFPSLDDVRAVNRLDTNLFRPSFRQHEFLIKNYTKGYRSIRNLNFDISRGQNLQISNIGKSIYSDKHYPNFYTLMLPKYISRYGTVDEIEYLGNKNKLKTLKKGDLIFGAEGFEKGRSIVITDESSKTITNIHGITLHHRESNMVISIFVKCFLDYLRNTGLVDLYAVGGNGGSLAMKYWDIIPFPNFPQDKQTEIAKLYHNADVVIAVDQLTVDNFIATDNLFNEIAGIVELDRTAKIIKARIDEVIDLIVRDEPVKIDFDFLLPTSSEPMPPADIAH